MLIDYAYCNDVQMTGNHRPTDNWPMPVRTLRKGVIVLFSEYPVIVTTPAAGLITSDPHLNIAESRTALCAKGLMEVVPNKPFHVLIGNISARPIQIRKQMCVPTASLPPENIMYIRFLSTSHEESPRREV